MPGVFQRIARTATVQFHPIHIFGGCTAIAYSAVGLHAASPLTCARTIFSRLGPRAPVISGHDWLAAPGTRPGAYAESRVSAAMDRIIRCARGRCALIQFELAVWWMSRSETGTGMDLSRARLDITTPDPDAGKAEPVTRPKLIHYAPPGTQENAAPAPFRS
jgi:hypothetical protein